MYRPVGYSDSMHRIGGITLVQPQSEAGWCWVKGWAQVMQGGSEDGLIVGESTANIDERRARLDWRETKGTMNRTDRNRTVTGEILVVRLAGGTTVEGLDVTARDLHSLQLQPCGLLICAPCKVGTLLELIHEDMIAVLAKI
jgi:hypothetical protein